MAFIPSKDESLNLGMLQAFSIRPSLLFGSAPQVHAEQMISQLSSKNTVSGSIGVQDDGLDSFFSHDIPRLTEVKEK